MVVTPVWRRRPVYVTSTFCDMLAEREYLRTSVFPELQKRLGPRRHHLEPIDLRGGVEFTTPEDQADWGLQALKVCLAEISRARPFQIVLLGDCYGCIPPGERAETAVEEAGLQTDVTGKSLTELEIEFGLSEAADPSRCFFYFREPLPYDWMPDDVVVHYYDPHHAEQLADLKDRIEQQMPGRVRHYRAEWDQEKQAVSGLDDWGRMVLDDLWQALDDATRADADLPPPTWLEQQRGRLNQFVKARRRRFVGRQAITEQLLKLARSPAEPGKTWGACLTGISGAGKSALFAHLHGRLEQEDVVLLWHASAARVGSFQVDAMLRRWTPELARALKTDNPLTDAATSREVEASFVELLRRASEGRRVVLLIDGLNQFEPTPRAQRLSWLPDPWPDNARLIATTRPGVASEALEQRPGVEIVPLPPLTPDEARQLAETVWDGYRRRAQPEVVDALLSKRLPGGSLAAGIPLWLETAVEELTLLDADDSAGVGGDGGGTPQERLDRLAVDVARELPSDVEALYGWILRRNEAVFGAGWLAGFVNLIALSRNGLRESTLAVLLPKVARLLAPNAPRVVWSDLNFALVRRAFRAHLVQHGPEGEWDFAHAQLRETIRRRNLRDPQLVQQLHTAIAYHLKSLPATDPVRQTELMVHLIGSEDRLRAAHYYSGELTEAELAGATRSLADHILAESNQTSNPGLAWAASLLIEPKLQRSQVSALCRRYNVDLLDALANNAPVDARRRLAEATRQAAEELLEQEPDNADWRQSLATSYQLLADFHQEAGNQAEAGDCRNRCRETLRALRDAGAELSQRSAELLGRLEQ